MMNPELRYAGFWRRFGALWLDVVFLLPLTLLVYWAGSRFRLFYAVYCIPSFCIGAFYSIYLVRRFGGTPGKVVAGLRIAKLDGSAVGYREAFLRFLPDFVLSILMSAGLILATFKMSDGEYTGMDFVQRSQMLVALAPVWFRPVRLFQTIWVWSELLVMLTNKRRRALHDFLAGTVVVLREPSQPPEPPLLRPATPL